MIRTCNSDRANANVLKSLVPDSSPSHRTVVGVDLGGTNVRACVFGENGLQVGEKVSEPSNAQSGSEAIFKAIGDAIRRAIASTDGAKPAMVGMAIPGIVDNTAGVIRWAPNFGETVNGVFRSWKNVDVRTPLESVVGIPFCLGNDANLAALGEYRFGSGKNQASCLVLLTMGTGIGGGVVMAPHAVSGQARSTLLLLGGNQGGAELGHTIVQKDGVECSAGEYGSIEAYCQRDSIVRRAQHKLSRGRVSCLTDMANGDLAQLTPLILSQAAAQKDAVALEVWAEVGEFLGIGIGNMINIFSPDIVAIGGQIAKVGEPLLASARHAAQSVAIPDLFDFAKIGQAEQIEDAGLLGGAALALEAIH